MDNWLTNIVDNVDSLHVEIDNLNDLLEEFCFIKSIDIARSVSNTALRQPPPSPPTPP
jgi:hypothetical protein